MLSESYCLVNELLRVLPSPLNCVILHIMKVKDTKIFLLLSSLALIILLVIQVQWIFKTAKVKEELFNEKANMVLSKTAEALCSDKETCMKMGECNMSGGNKECKLMLGDHEEEKIDSLLKYYMSLYNFHIAYSFEVLKPGTSIEDHEHQHENEAKNSYKTSLEAMAFNSGLELNLIFPDKMQFIRNEMGVMFLSSVMLILIILVFFWLTVRSLWAEKMIYKNTTDFLNNMTHEFKTPLTNIALAGKMIGREQKNDNREKIREYSSIILSENEKLQHQVEQVLSMAALERGEIPLCVERIDVHSILLAAIKCMRLQIESAGGEIKTDLQAEKTELSADKHHLSNAICNLVDNAIKYAKGKPEISINTLSDDKTLNLIVQDKGIGIEKKYKKDIFNKYFRVTNENLHDVKGFGLGLAYVKKIIELHNGTIEVESEPGKGTSFIIQLPLS